MIDTRSAFIAIVGKPNVGKSSLLNALTGHKIAIVTNQPPNHTYPHYWCADKRTDTVCIY